MDSPGVQWILHCLSHKHMHQYCCFLNAKTQLTQPLEKIHKDFPIFTNGHEPIHSTRQRSVWIGGGIMWGHLFPPLRDHLSKPSQHFFTQQSVRSKGSDPKQALARSGLPEEKAVSEVAEHKQQNWSCFCFVPAMSRNSRFSIEQTYSGSPLGKSC